MKAGIWTGAALACALAVVAIAAIPASAGSAKGGASAKSACPLSTSEQRDLEARQSSAFPPLVAT